MALHRSCKSLPNVVGKAGIFLGNASSPSWCWGLEKELSFMLQRQRLQGGFLTWNNAGLGLWAALRGMSRHPKCLWADRFTLTAAKGGQGYPTFFHCGHTGKKKSAGGFLKYYRQDTIKIILRRQCLVRLCSCVEKQRERTALSF